MGLGSVGELKLLESIRRRFAGRRPSVLTGIGDDAAVLAPGAGELLATTDMMVEGVHFDLGLTSPRQLGFKLVAVNVSDIYAMNGRPAHALLAMALHPSTEEAFVAALLDGVHEAAGLYGLSVVGGDVSSSPAGLALTLTVLGRARRPVLRSGALPGHGIYVTGTLGDSACGLALLKRIGRVVDLARPPKGPVRPKAARRLLARHLMPEPRAPGTVTRGAKAMIDISDGLLLDLTRLCGESGVGARLVAGKVPLSVELKAAAPALGLDPLSLALGGGEDYELLFTAPRARGRGRPGATLIGEVVQSGMTVEYPGGRTGLLKPEGYDHFKGRRK